MSGRISRARGGAFDVFIPARFGSCRLPGKPLRRISGKPLIQYVFECARDSTAARVVVATDDGRIAAAVRNFGGEACLTDAGHLSGTDRIAEAVKILGTPADRVIVNVQGDEPQMPGKLINEVAQRLYDDPAAVMATACCRVSDELEFRDPNIVKVVVDANGAALYFSRAPIPWPRDDKAIQAYRHIGIYSYRVDFLATFTGWERCWLEQTERLEQLRILHHGGRIAVLETAHPPGLAIDTEDDLAAFTRMIESKR